MSKADTKAYQAENLQRPGARHGFFTRKGGVSGGIYEGLNVGLGSDDDADAVTENRRRAVSALNEKATLVTPYQVHGTVVATVYDNWTSDDHPRADALVTNDAGIALGIVTADCVPVLLSDPDGGVIGVTHAGWKGALGGVLENTIAAMTDLGARRRSISAAIGPAISQASYEVGPELRQAFISENPDDDAFFMTNENDRYQFDLVGFVVARLQQAGIESVSVEAKDTYALSGEFYSYRRATHLSESDYGRQLSAIVRI